MQEKWAETFLEIMSTIFNIIARKKYQQYGSNEQKAHGDKPNIKHEKVLANKKTFINTYTISALLFWSVLPTRISVGQPLVWVFFEMLELRAELRTTERFTINQLLRVKQS